MSAKIGTGPRREDLFPRARPALARGHGRGSDGKRARHAPERLSPGGGGGVFSIGAVLRVKARSRLIEIANVVHGSGPGRRGDRGEGRRRSSVRKGAIAPRANA